MIHSQRTPEAIQPSEERHLATHRSLVAMIAELDGVDPEMVAVGEIHKTNGRISILNNKSGTFGGTLINLGYAKEELAKYGLPLEEKTQFIDYSTSPRKDGRHLKEWKASEIDAKYRGLEAYRKFAELYRRLAEKYPDQNTLGHFDVELIRKKIIGNMKAMPRVKGWYTLKEYVIYTYPKDVIPWLQEESIAFSSRVFVEPDPNGATNRPTLDEVVTIIERDFLSDEPSSSP